jgi:hypothetical protein
LECWIQTSCATTNSGRGICQGCERGLLKSNSLIQKKRHRYQWKFQIARMWPPLALKKEMDLLVHKSGSTPLQILTVDSWYKAIRCNSGLYFDLNLAVKSSYFYYF